MTMKLLLVGATGLVGKLVLELALNDPRIHKVVAPSRSALPAHPKLEVPIVDFEHLPADAPWWQGVDAVICTLGTTMKAAGSELAFKRVDHDYPLAVATLALRHGTTAYILTSATGADATSKFFYNQVKGALEDHLQHLGFHSLTFVRPGVIDAKRAEFRLGESILLGVLKILKPMLPKRWHSTPALHIAHALLDAAVDRAEGVHVIDAAHLA